MLEKKKRGRPKKEKVGVDYTKSPVGDTVPFNTTEPGILMNQNDPENPFNKPLFPETESEEIPAAELDRMIDKAEAKKVAEVKKVELTVDAQDWTNADPVIPEALAIKVWVAVFACPVKHKTKATNRQEAAGVKCWVCGEKAEMMPQFARNQKIEKRKGE